MKHLLALSLLFPSTAALADTPKEITKACQPGGGFFRAFPGDYTVRLKIGERVFLDGLSITRMTRSPGMGNGQERFQGTFTATGIFTAPIEEGIIGKVVRSERNGVFYDNELSFKITAKEGGREYPVFFKARGEENAEACLLRGHAYSPTPDKHFGTMAIMKNTPDCTCTP